MRVNDDYAKWNAAAQAGDADSVHAFWKHAIEVRKQHDVLVSQRSRSTSSLGVATLCVVSTSFESVLCVEVLRTGTEQLGK